MNVPEQFQFTFDGEQFYILDKIVPGTDNAADTGWQPSGGPLPWPHKKEDGEGC